MADTWTPIDDPTAFQDDAVFEIDKTTKSIQVLVEQPIVAGENKSQFIKFQMGRYYDAIDLTGMEVNILYESPTGYQDISSAVNREYSDEYIRFGWIVPYAACPVKGTLSFAVEFVGADYTLKTTKSTTEVLDSIAGSSAVPEPVEQTWYIELQSQTAATLQAASDAMEKAQQIINALATPQSAALASEMVDASTVYVYTGSENGYSYGYWYFHNGTSWVRGGKYVSTDYLLDSTLSNSGQAADAKAVSYLLESTENIFNLDDFLTYGWERTEKEVSGALSALSGSKLLDEYSFEAETAYTLSLEAYNTGNVSADSNNGLRIRIYYTDSTYAQLTVKNNTLSYRFGALITDPAKTVDYINVGYSNSGGNVWHIRNIMFAKGEQIVPYSAYRSCVDTVARNKADIPQSAINKYVWDDLTPTLANGWVLDGVGTSVRDANGQLAKYAVTAGQVLWLNIGKYAEGVFQFQDSASVNSTGSINPSIIGRPCVDAVNDVVVVPEGATYLIASQSVNNPACCVRIAQLPKVLPAYWGKYIDAKAREISRQVSPPVGNGTRFAFITDVHLRNADGSFRNAGYSPLLMRYLHEHCNIGLAFFGGDTTTGSYASLDNAVDDLMLFRDTFSSVWDWMYCVFGNHEFGNNESSLPAMDKSIIYNAFIRDKERDYTAVNSVYGSYILDNAAEKIRFICLNLNEGNNLTQQNDFFCSALRDTPAGWTIIFITHFTLENDGGTIKISTKLTNTNSIVPAIEAYNARQVYGNYDFTTAGAEVACVIGGHTHWDGMVKTSGGVPVIAVACDMHTGITGMAEGTTTEQCFDVFTIDTSAKTITTKRIGYGADRVFTYGTA